MLWTYAYSDMWFIRDKGSDDLIDIVHHLGDEHFSKDNNLYRLEGVDTYQLRVKNVINLLKSKNKFNNCFGETLTNDEIETLIKTKEFCRESNINSFNVRGILKDLFKQIRKLEEK